MAKNNKKTIKQFNLIDWMDQYIFRKSNLWWLVLFLFCARMIQLHIIDEGLRENGICTYAIVIGETHSPRGGGLMVYRYFVPEVNQYFNGTTGYDCSVGETIEILYNPKHPKQSESKEYLSKKKK